MGTLSISSYIVLERDLSPELNFPEFIALLSNEVMNEMEIVKNKFILMQLVPWQKHDMNPSLLPRPPSWLPSLMEGSWLDQIPELQLEGEDVL